MRLFNLTNNTSIPDMVWNSLIIGGFCFFSALIGQEMSLESLYQALIAAGLAFFAQLIHEKGIKPQLQNAPSDSSATA